MWPFRPRDLQGLEHFESVRTDDLEQELRDLRQYCERLQRENAELRAKVATPEDCEFMSAFHPIASC